MNIEELAQRLEQVRFTGLGLTARCPAHEDRSPSLSVREGTHSILVKCFAGCDFFEIVRVLGLKPHELKLNTPVPVLPETGTAAMRLRRMKNWQPSNIRISEVVTLALNPPRSAMAQAWMHYPELSDLLYHEAMKYSVVLFDGPIFEMILPILDATWPGWSKIEIKRDVFARLARTYRERLGDGTNITTEGRRR